MFGQEVRTIIKVADRNNLPIPFAAMQVVNIGDSANKHYEEMADSLGRVALMLEVAGKYIVRVHAIGYKPAAKNIVVKGEHPVFVVTAEADSKMLKDVEVTFKKPLLKQEDDKTIVDPEELASSSTSAYEIMEKVPGLFVDQDGNIYITSTTPATIYINGREQKMSNADVAAMLKSLPPNSIEKIEILRTPSARYDASTSGGIVNVVLKKGVHIGLTGSANAGMNQGTYGNQFAGITVNNSNGVWSSTLNLQASRRASGERLKTNRMFAPDSTLSQDAFTKYPGQTFFGYYSIGYTPGKKWDISYDGRISANKNPSSSTSWAEVDVEGGPPALSYKDELTNDNSNVNITQGFSTKFKPDTLGSEWTTDLSWNYVPTNGTQSYVTTYTIPVPGELSGNGTIKTHLQYLSLRTDGMWKLPHKSSLEGGIKLTSTWFDNNTDYKKVYHDSMLNDASRTNAFSYDEHIFAAYLQASKDISGVLVKTGVRMENTDMNGDQVIPKDTSFRVNRPDFFPYVYISRKVMKIAGYELRSYLIYRRTITRPSYDYLNPFPRYVDEYTSDVGNPSLKPQFTKNYEANVSVDERPIVAIGYNDITDIFSQVVYQGDSSHRQTLRTYDNLGSNKELYLRGLGAIPPGKTYFFVLGAQYNHNIYNGQYEGAPLNYARGSWTLFTYQTLKLGKLTQLVLNGFIKFNGLIQFYELNTFGSLNMSVNHQFLQKKLKVTMSVTDMFLTNNYQFTLRQGSIDAYGLRKGDTRRFGLNAAYNFGIRKKEEHNFLNAESPEGESK